MMKNTIKNLAPVLAALLLAAGQVSAQRAAGAVVPEGKIFNARGKVECLRAGRKAWEPVTPPFTLVQGDTVRTGPRSTAEIYMRHGAKVRLKANTRFRIEKISPERNSVRVMAGRLEAWIKKNTRRRFEVRTPSAVCAVRGTTFSVAVYRDGRTVWDLFKGAVDVYDQYNRAVSLSDNQRLMVTKDQGAEPVTAIPAGVGAPAEPVKTAEERIEEKAALAAEAKAAAEAKTRAEAEAKAEAEAAAKAEAEAKALAEEEARAAEEAAGQAAEPAVNPTQEARESAEVSGSTP